ncbi:MAG: universal stress protein [Chitinophagales bacterium]
MKKILFICDSDHFPKGAFELIKFMHSTEPVFLKGIFFSTVDYEQLVSVSNFPNTAPYFRFKEEDKSIINKSKARFSRLCENAGIKFNTHEGELDWDREAFTKESRFADLAVISEELYCANYLTRQPNIFMQELLHTAECPVLIVPENFKTIDRIAYAYDSKKESVFALKQFASFFPQLTDLPMETVYTSAEKSDHIPDLDLLKEYAAVHFNSFGASKLHFDGKKFLSTWLEDKKNALLVCGAFSRSAVSNLLNRSFADQVIRDHVSPVFIAH